MAKVKSIDYIGEKEQQCIVVDAKDSLYVTNNEVITHNSVVSGVLSELTFFRDAGKDDTYIMNVYNNTKSRVDSRMKGNYFGRTILDSSPNTLDSPIDDYIVNHADKDPINYIVKGSMWEWVPEEYDLTRTFKVFTGGTGKRPQIIEKDLVGFDERRIIDVPMELLQQFKDDIYGSIKNLAGIPAGVPDGLIYDTEKIEGVFHEKMKNIYTHITAPSDQNPTRLIWNQIEPLFFKKRAGTTEFWYKPHIPRCIAVDQSLSNDVSCIAAVHVERIEGSDDHKYVVDFTIPIAPMGGRVNLDAIRFFIEDLRNLGNMYISHVSFDNFQSDSSIQYLQRRGFETEKLSVDKTTDPYLNMVSIIETGRLVCGRNLYVKNNLKSLRMVRPIRGGKLSKPKVDHDTTRHVITEGDDDWSRSRIGSYAKDATDAVAAAIDLNRLYHPIAFDMWSEEYLNRITDPTLEKEDAKSKLSAFLNEHSFA